MTATSKVMAIVNQWIAQTGYTPTIVLIDEEDFARFYVEIKEVIKFAHHDPDCPGKDLTYEEACRSGIQMLARGSGPARDRILVVCVKAIVTDIPKLMDVVRH